MTRFALAFGIVLLLMANGGVAAEAGETYADYYAARRALERDDCDTGIRHLEAYLRNHPYIQEKHPDHYREVTFAMARCRGAVQVRGIGDESEEMAPLPDHPPMAE